MCSLLSDFELVSTFVEEHRLVILEVLIVGIWLLLRLSRYHYWSYHSWHDCIDLDQRSHLIWIGTKSSNNSARWAYQCLWLLPCRLGKLTPVKCSIKFKVNILEIISTLLPEI